MLLVLLMVFVWVMGVLWLWIGVLACIFWLDMGIGGVILWSCLWSWSWS